MKHFRFAGLEFRFFLIFFPDFLDLVQWAKGQNLELRTGNFKLNRELRLHAIFTCNMYASLTILKFTFSEKATKIDKINLTLCSNRQIDG
jgi:hypothetical protein